MTSQESLFPNTELIKPENVNRKLEQDKHSREYCFRQILDEEYLWDMRCWFKPKEQYTKEEIKRQILKWIKDESNGKWNFNCGHSVYCIRRVLNNQWATFDEVIDLVIRNNKVKYADSIGSWFKSFA
jgi:hypothetical protein